LGGGGKEIFHNTVLSLTNIDPIGERLKKAGIRVDSLGMSRGVPNPFSFLKLLSLIGKIDPDIIQTWMFHADLIGGIAGRISGISPILWNIRSSPLDVSTTKKTTLWTVKACSKLSHYVPDVIVGASRTAQLEFARTGYDLYKIVFIPNGIDTDEFKPDPKAQRRLKRKLDIPDDSLLIGLVARYDPQKDHNNFIESARRLHSRFSEVHFILCGDRVSWENRELADRITKTGIQERFHLLGRCDEITLIMASLDIATITSAYGEAFPNVIAEAMASGVPCVATDVGDTHLIVGNTGRIVPPGDSSLFSEALFEISKMDDTERRMLGGQGRARIKTEFSLSAMVSRYETLYKTVCVNRSNL